MIKMVNLMVIIVITLLSLTGCVADSERLKTTEIIDKARPVIEEYVESNGYSKIEEIKGLFINGGFLKLKASGYVIATISNEDDTFDIVCNVEENKIYTNIGYKDKVSEIESILDIDGVTEINISLVSNDLVNAGLTNTNFISVSDKLDCKINAFIKMKSDKLETSIYKAIDKLGDVDYDIAIIIGDESGEIRCPWSLNFGIDISEYKSSSESILLNIDRINGNIEETVIELVREDIDDGYIVFDNLKYAVTVSESDTKLGEIEVSSKDSAIEHSSLILGDKNEDRQHESSKDYKVEIQSLDSSNDKIEISVYSNKYKNLVYMNNETLETIISKLHSVKLFSLTNSADILLGSTLGIQSITMALFNNTDKE